MASRYRDDMDYEAPMAISGIGGPAPVSGFSVPSWMRPSGGDVRGTTPYEQIQLNPGTNYRLVDFTGRNDNTVLAQGSTPEDLARIQQIVNSQLVPKGRQADWRLERATDDGQFETIGGDYYNNSFLKNAAMLALPAGLAVLSGGLLGAPAASALGIGKAAGLGVAAGLGSTAGNLAVGKPLGTSLLSGGITGLSAGLLSGLGGTVPAGGAAPGPDIAVNAPVAGLGGGVMSLPAFAAPSLAGLGGAIAGSVPGEIVVTAARNALSPALSGLGGAALSTGIGSLSPSVGQIADMLGPQTTEDPEIVVTKPRLAPDVSPMTGVPVAPLTIAGAAGTAAAAATPPPKKTLLDYLQAGAGGLSVLQGIGDLLAGEQNLGAGIGGGFNPNSGTVSFQPLNRQQNAPTFDPFTYGQNSGEFRFFNDAQPQYQINQPAGVAPDPLRLARGGPIRGIGGGQDDLIDAKLSDGEYVFSAQDVSDLGDGSNEAGARKLTAMRKLIRKQAGRKNTETIAPPQKSVRSILRAAR
jgi:hypothetical protein